MKAENFINYKKKKKMKIEYGLEVNIFTLIIKTSIWSWLALDILTLIEKKLFFVREHGMTKNFFRSEDGGGLNYCF